MIYFYWYYLSILNSKSNWPGNVFIIELYVIYQKRWNFRKWKLSQLFENWNNSKVISVPRVLVSSASATLGSFWKWQRSVPRVGLAHANGSGQYQNLFFSVRGWYQQWQLLAEISSADVREWCNDPAVWSLLEDAHCGAGQKQFQSSGNSLSWHTKLSCCCRHRHSSFQHANSS
jgi:hypothetical protein